MVSIGMPMVRNVAIIVLLGQLVGCAVNPVTGKNELSLFSEKWELDTGKQQYVPLRQAQGGDYVVDPKVEAYVAEVGQKLAAVSDRQLPYEFHVINSSVPNAWALPGGKVSINRGLLTQLQSEAELAAVLGHEIVHAAARHGAKGAERNVLFQSALLATAIAVQGEDYGQLVQMGAGVGSQLVSKKYGRDAERESDKYGVEYMVRAGYDPQGAVDLQETFVAMSEGKKTSWLEGLLASHPASRERVENNRQLAATYPKGGVMGRERYQQMMAYLQEKKPAYEAYDKAQALLQKGDGEQAVAQLSKALAVEPKEGHFHSLSGDLDLQKKAYDKAKAHFDTAISLNDEFFYYYLRRGQVQKFQQHYSLAEKDLKRSNQLLPTPIAYNALGDVAKAQGRTAEAKAYYAKVADQKGTAGELAYSSLVELDLPDNPNKYLSVKNLTDRQGRWIISVSNPTPHTVTNIELSIRYPDQQGQRYEERSTITQRLSPGQAMQMSTGMKIDSRFLDFYEVNVLTADLVK